MTVKIINFGCRLNSYESELMKDKAEKAGLQGAIIFNSCTVTNEAERQLRQAIRREKKAHPEAKLIVTGCAAQVNPEKYANMSEVDLVLGNSEKLEDNVYELLNKSAKNECTQELTYDFAKPTSQMLDSDKSKVSMQIPKLQDKILVSDIQEIKEINPHLVSSFEGHIRGFLQVQNGCNHRCTFCIIPYGRGNSRSIPLGEIVKQAQLLVDNGYNELVLTGVDITDYGLDLPGKPSLGLTVKRLLTLVPGLRRLRMSSLDVAEIDEDLLEMMIQDERVMPHLHLSVQAGDNLILKRMARRHNREQVLDFCEKVRKARPEITFGADIIVGFPTENDAMFENTCDLVKDAGIQFLHVFPYSERQKTPAARMPQVDKQVRKERARILRELGRMQLQSLYKGKIGRTEEVLIEESGYGRARDYSKIKLYLKDQVSKNTEMFEHERNQHVHESDKHGCDQESAQHKAFFAAQKGKIVNVQIIDVQITEQEEFLCGEMYL